MRDNKMTPEDKIARMYEIMHKLAEIEYEREMTLRRRDRKQWQLIYHSLPAQKGWATRRANLAARKAAA